MASVAWIDKQIYLLDLEKEAEQEQLKEKLDSLTAVQCQEIGLSLLHLEVESSCTSLYGRVTYTFAKRDKTPLPVHQMKAGDEAEVYDPQLQPTKTSASSGKHGAEHERVCGVVSKVTPSSIDFVCDDAPGDEGSSSWLLESSSLRLNMRSSEATHKKLIAVLEGLRGVAGGQSGKAVKSSVCCEESTAVLLDLLLAKEPSRAAAAPAGMLDAESGRRGALVPFNHRLNQSQLDAITFALNGPSRVSLIHGPPGTGKTTAVTELILQALIRGKKVLVCAPSNVAVDNILERLVAERYSYRPADYFSGSSAIAGSSGVTDVKVQAVRIGHPARMSSAVHRHCLDALVLHHEGTEIVQDVRKDIDTSRKQLSKINGRKDRTKKRDLQVEIRVLRKEARKREDQVLNQIMASRNVVLATCVGAASRLLREMSFDLVVVDEAAQALEAACWIPLTHCQNQGRVVLAGDHCQLPPTIKSTEAASKGLSVTLFERIIHHPVLHTCARLLDTQYRMHELISSWASKEMYDSRLVAHSSNASHTLLDLSSRGDKAGSGSGSGDDLSGVVMMLVDTAGCDMDEEGGNGGGSAKTALSYRNTHEAYIVYKHIQQLYALGLAPEQIGVITPYNGQLECLRDLLHGNEDEGEAGSEKASSSKEVGAGTERLEIRTVDGFQGGEKEAIIISLVRSNAQRQVGFLAEKRRINVAVTRAKRHVMVVCDSDTVSADPFIKDLLDHISSQGGEHRSALEYVDSPLVSETAEHATLTAEAISQLTCPVAQPRSVNDSNPLPLPPSKPGKLKTFNKKTQGALADKRKKSGLGKEETTSIPTDRGVAFKDNISSMLKLLARATVKQVPDIDNEAGTPGGTLGPAALRRLYSDLSQWSSRAKAYSGGGGASPSVGDGMSSFARDFITPHSQASRARIRAAIAKQYSVFTSQWPLGADEDFFTKLLVFPASLNSHERRVVHSVADELNEESQHLNSSLLSLHHQSFDIASTDGETFVRQLLVACHPFDTVAVPSASLGGDKLSPHEDTDARMQKYFTLEVMSESESGDDEDGNEGMGATSMDGKASNTVSHGANNSSKKKKKKKKSSKKLGGVESLSGDSGYSTIGGKKLMGPAGGAGTRKVAEALRNDELDELALLEMTISENEKLQEYNKYRVGFRGAMPNYEKTSRSEALQAKIQKAKEARSSDPVESTSSSRKKKAKKPPGSRS